MRDAWFGAAELLGRHEGVALMPARTLVLKGLLETELPVGLLAGPVGGGLGGLFASEPVAAAAEVLERHGLERAACPGGARAVDLAASAAIAGTPSVAWVPWRDVAGARRALRAAAAGRLPRGSGMLVLLEDSPSEPTSACPLAAAAAAGLPTLVAPDLPTLRDLIDIGVRGSRACRRPFALVLHATLLASAETCELFPNRASPPVELSLARRRVRRRPIAADAADAMRVIRRAELNRPGGMPSPGERVPIGFVAVGAATPALEHLVEVLALRGRVPHVSLAATAPLDEAAVGRLLERCEHVIVLEPRPGTVERDVLAVAEGLRRGGGRPATVWGREVPTARVTGDAGEGVGEGASAGAGAPGDAAERASAAAAGPGPEGGRRAVPVVDPAAPPVPMGPDDAVHPSRLARRIVDLLHVIRPGGRLAERLVMAPRIEPPAARPAPGEAGEEGDEDEAAGATPEGTAAEHDGEESARDRDAGGHDEAVPYDERPLPPRSAGLGVAAALRIVREVASEVDQRLRHREPTEEELEEGPPPPGELLVERWIPPSPRRRVALLEAWGARRFAIEGAAAVRQACRDGRSWVLAVCDVARGDAADPRRLALAVAPADRRDEVAVVEARLDDRRELAAAIQSAALAGGVTVLVVREEDRPVVGPEPLERRLADIDRLGFNPRQEVTWSIDRLCAIRPEPPELSTDPRGLDESVRLESLVRVDRVSERPGFRFRLRVRPLREQVVVVRTRAPLGRRSDEPRLSPPTARHGSRPAWRVHVAGWRGAAPGVVPWLLARAGARMGYHVRLQHDATPVGVGVRAWSQLLFTRPRPGEPAPALVGRTPFGEADLVLGLDPVETLRAVVEDPGLRVAARPTSTAIVNTGRPSEELGGDAAREARAIAAARLGPALEATTTTDRQLLDMAAACRRRFHSDRLADAALLGLAFQRGLVPVTLDALNAAVQEAETAGWGRVAEAVRFGRMVAIEPRLLESAREDREDDARTIARRAILLHRRRGRDRFADLLRRSLEGMPGLMETDAGRTAARDFVVGVIRCELWGGPEYARSFADRIAALYRADAPETGRRLTRRAVLPLASVMLIRDPFYLAALVAAPEHRRRTRRWLDIRRARADMVERRYLTRVELFVLDRRIRMELRTSDWPARLTQRLRPMVEDRLRGTRRERRLRDEVQALVDRAIAESPGSPERRARWEEAFGRLHPLALDNRIRSMAINELRMLVGTD